MRQVTITQLFPSHGIKSFEFEEVRATFPSIGCSLKSINDLKAFIEAEKNGGTNGCSIIFLPLYSAQNLLNYLNSHYSSEFVESFFKRHPLMIDFETEFWYYKNQHVEKRKEAFSKIEGKPKDWETLFSIPIKGIKDIPSLKKNTYESKIKNFFDDEKRKIQLIVSSMKHAHKELKASIICPPSPLIINTGYSLQASLDMNKWFNQYRVSFDLMSACYYNLHHEAFKQESTYTKIINQIFEINPKFVIISTPDSENYLYEHVCSMKKPIFKKFIKDLSLYARTNGAIVVWLDKGDFTSNWGLRLLKEGIDCFAYPLKGTGKEFSGKGSLKPGEMFGQMLNEYAYQKWDRYLAEAKNKGVPCHLPCCSKENYNSLKSLTDRQQWEFKRKHELFTRSEQVRQILEKLHQEGNLDDFETRLKRNGL